MSDTEAWKRAAQFVYKWQQPGGDSRGECLNPGDGYEHFTSFAAGVVHPQWFCDKLTTNLSPADEPSGVIDTSDIIVGVYRCACIAFRSTRV